MKSLVQREGRIQRQVCTDAKLAFFPLCPAAGRPEGAKAEISSFRREMNTLPLPPHPLLAAFERAAQWNPPKNAHSSWKGDKLQEHSRPRAAFESQAHLGVISRVPLEVLLSAPLSPRLCREATDGRTSSQWRPREGPRDRSVSNTSVRICNPHLHPAS